MSKCDLYIQLDEASCRYRAGDKIEGDVAVNVDEDCKCDGLTLEYFWRTHGKGNRASGESRKLKLFEGNWSAGESQRYRFAIDVPVGPSTYRGQLLNVGWYLKARADIPWAIDPKVERDFIVEPPAEAADYDPGPLYKQPALAQREMRSMRGMLPVAGFIFSIAGIAFLVMASKSYEPDLFDFLLPGFFTLCGIVMTVLGLRRTFAQRKLGRPNVRIDPRTVAPGQALRVEVRLQPKYAATINSVTAQLQAREVVVHGSGTRKTTHSQIVYEMETPLTVGKPRLRAGERRRMQADFGVPPDAPLSFTARDNAVRWELAVHIDVESWPDWHETFPIGVLPAGAGSRTAP